MLKWWNSSLERNLLDSLYLSAVNSSHKVFSLISTNAATFTEKQDGTATHLIPHSSNPFTMICCKGAMSRRWKSCTIKLAETMPADEQSPVIRRLVWGTLLISLPLLLRTRFDSIPRRKPLTETIRGDIISHLLGKRMPKLLSVSATYSIRVDTVKRQNDTMLTNKMTLYKLTYRDHPSLVSVHLESLLNKTHTKPSYCHISWDQNVNLFFFCGLSPLIS